LAACRPKDSPTLENQFTKKVNREDQKGFAVLSFAPTLAKFGFNKKPARDSEVRKEKGHQFQTDFERFVVLWSTLSFCELARGRSP